MKTKTDTNAESTTATVPAQQEVAETPRVFSNEELLVLQLASLTLHLKFLESAAKSLIERARPASKAQSLVLKGDLEELGKRIKAAEQIEWPVLGDNNRDEPQPPKTKQL